MGAKPVQYIRQVRGQRVFQCDQHAADRMGQLQVLGMQEKAVQAEGLAKEPIDRALAIVGVAHQRMAQVFEVVAQLVAPAAPAASAARTWSGLEMPKPSTDGGAPRAVSRRTSALWSTWAWSSAPVTLARVTTYV